MGLTISTHYLHTIYTPRNREDAGVFSRGHRCAGFMDEWSLHILCGDEANEKYLYTSDMEAMFDNVVKFDFCKGSTKWCLFRLIKIPAGIRWSYESLRLLQLIHDEKQTKCWELLLMWLQLTIPPLLLELQNVSCFEWENLDRRRDRRQLQMWRK